MKKAMAFILIIGIGFLGTKYGPWYMMAFAGFAGGLILKNQWRALLVGFLGGFTLWMFQIWLMADASDSDLPARMANLFSLPGDSFLMILSAVVGGLLTGFGAATGGCLYNLFTHK